jgi:hypothetical protein
VTFQPDSLHAYLFLFYCEFNRDARVSLSSPKALPPFDLTDRALPLVDGHGGSRFPCGLAANQDACAEFGKNDARAAILGKRRLARGITIKIVRQEKHNDSCG